MRDEPGFRGQAPQDGQCGAGERQDPCSDATTGSGDARCAGYRYAARAAGLRHSPCLFLHRRALFRAGSAPGEGFPAGRGILGAGTHHQGRQDQYRRYPYRMPDCLAPLPASRRSWRGSRRGVVPGGEIRAQHGCAAHPAAVLSDFQAICPCGWTGRQHYAPLSAGDLHHPSL